MSMELRMALRGKLDEYIAKEGTRTAKAITLAMRRVTRGAELHLEQAYASAGLGKLARAWNSRTYPTRGQSFSPAGFVFGKGRWRTHGALTSHGAGSVIRPTGARRNLAIPTEATPRRQGRAITPAEYDPAMLGPLRFIKRPGRVSLLVVDNVRVGSRGRARRLRRVGNDQKGFATSLTGRASAILWFLVPIARQPQLVDARGIARGWAARAGAFVDEAYNQLPPPKV